MPFIGLRAFLNSRGWGQTGRGLRLQLLAVLTLSLSPLLVLSVAQGVIEFREERQEQLARFHAELVEATAELDTCLLYTSPSPRDGLLSRMPSSA